MCNAPKFGSTKTVQAEHNLLVAQSFVENYQNQRKESLELDISRSSLQWSLKNLKYRPRLLEDDYHRRVQDVNSNISWVAILFETFVD